MSSCRRCNVLRRSGRSMDENKGNELKVAQLEQKNKPIADLGWQLDEWLRSRSDYVNADQFAGILRTLLKLAQDDAERGDLKILNRTLQELRHAFRIFAPYRHMRKVSIFGSTRLQEREPHYGFAPRTGEGLAPAAFVRTHGAAPCAMEPGRR